jgi:uncharacterized delta-60 repeat protein
MFFEGIRPPQSALLNGKVMCMKDSKWSATHFRAVSLLLLFAALTHNSPAAAVAVQPDGKILVGGHFTAFKGTNRSGIARLNANGSLDSSFNPGTGIAGSYDPVVTRFAVQPDDRILVGGSFSTFNGTVRNGMARLHANGSLDGSFDPGAGADGWVSSLTLQPMARCSSGATSPVSIMWCFRMLPAFTETSLRPLSASRAQTRSSSSRGLYQAQISDGRKTRIYRSPMAGRLSPGRGQPTTAPFPWHSPPPAAANSFA